MTRLPIIFSSEFPEVPQLRFEKGIHNLGMNCEVHIYDPTSSAPHEAIQLGWTLSSEGCWFESC